MEFLTMQAHKQLQGEEKPHKPFLQFTSLELRKLMIKGKVADNWIHSKHKNISLFKAIFL
ncbi:hypothetical protein ERO13_D01G061733v2 [Gossypium hirsutum]|uniref:Uncharacterized protein n=2 Tax=Gossypium TaxID=3633 RepID=A0A5D2W4L3_GOSMU|nr:hypothetical protein ERO13_D01G061733v2 [Gossypium hirsutum]TYG82404.1 hypothetical protein ES288_D01G084800v1 [Gossypium darwinii]TYI96571.1 hypothetical protein E1A91_D01G082000v1 [Gossypium mustelinum]